MRFLQKYHVFAVTNTKYFLEVGIRISRVHITLYLTLYNNNNNNNNNYNNNNNNNNNNAIN